MTTPQPGPKVWKFNLAQIVRITASQEHGTVIARSESIVSCDQYLMRYVNGQGVAVETWWSVDALESVA